MPNSPPERSKAAKRRLDDDEEPQKKRIRAEDSPSQSSPSKKQKGPKTQAGTGKGKNLAAARLARIRSDNKDPEKKLLKTPCNNNVLVKSTKKEPTKKPINDRLKHPTPRRCSSQDKNDSVLIISSSPASDLDDYKSPMTPRNLTGWSESIIVLSEASSSTPINRKLNDSRFNSSSKTLTPGSVCSTPKASKVLNRSKSVNSRLKKPLKSPESFEDAGGQGKKKAQAWVSVTQRPSFCETELSDSLAVNFDDTLLDKTLMIETKEDDSMEWEPVQEESPQAAEPTKLKTLCLIVDTNVLLHDLHIVKEIVELKSFGDQQIAIYLPWMVMQELDFFKDSQGSKVKGLAQAANKFVNMHMVQANARVLGQPVSDLSQQADLGKSPDDKILACCLLVRNRFDSVILVSNDVGLRNKALSNNIKAYSAKEVLTMLKCTKFQKIKTKTEAVLSEIVEQKCKEAFGGASLKIDMLQGGPWNFEGCLKRFKRFWMTVFGQLLLKQCQRCLDHLIASTNGADIPDSDGDQLKKFSDKLKEFLFYLQDIEQFNKSVKKLRDEIDAIVSGGASLT